MATYTQILYHIVFSTKNRINCLKSEKCDDLYRYIWGIIKNKNCYLYRINGAENHIHILTSLHPTISLSEFVKDIKVASTIWIKDNKTFQYFDGWQNGYAAFTYSIKEKQNVINYIKNQQKHHKKKTFKEELKELLMEMGIKYEEKM